MDRAIRGGVLSDRAILRHREEGSVVIDPFVSKNLATSSYDVTLGPWFYREQPAASGDIMVYNPWSESDVRRVWGDNPQRAEKGVEWIKRNGEHDGIRMSDEIIWIAPGETILAHTNEFIGGRHGKVTSMMKARSSLGRNFITVCKCAGWGDVGYVNRWTMEVSNSSQHYHIPLIVGRRVAQIVFFEVEQIIDQDYTKSGKYQGGDLEEIKAKWQPSAMLPKMYLDREVKGR